MTRPRLKPSLGTPALSFRRRPWGTGRWLVLIAALPLSAGEVGVSTGTVAVSTATAGSLTPSPFAAEAAKRFGADAEKVFRLQRRGFAKTELLTFIAISKASKKSWDDLVKEREGGKRLRKMAEDAGLDYDKLFEDSTRLKREIDDNK